MTLTYEEARDAFLRLARTGGRRVVPLPEAAGEVLAEDVVADRNLPPFHRSAMDGYAVRWTGKEAGASRAVVGTVLPGRAWEGTAGDGECVRIMTGAMVPSPFDTVIPLEAAEAAGPSSVRFLAPVSRGENVAREGEDAPKGRVLVPRGTLLSPRHACAIASAGRWEVPVFARPSVAVLATGGEIAEPWEPAEGARIRNGNAPFLLSALRAAGFAPVYLGIVPDDRDAIREKLSEGLSFDLLVATGGVSAGDTDLVPECLEASGVSRVFHRVAMQPGKPVYVGASPGGGAAVGLPGNPVAVMLHYAMLLRPFLLKSCGAAEYLPKAVRLPLAAPARNRGGRKKFVAARLVTDGQGSRVEEIPSRGSGDFVSVVRAEGVFEIPMGVAELPAGAPVAFHPVWGELLGPEG